MNWFQVGIELRKYGWDGHNKGRDENTEWLSFYGKKVVLSLIYSWPQQSTGLIIFMCFDSGWWHGVPQPCLGQAKYKNCLRDWHWESPSWWEELPEYICFCYFWKGLNVPHLMNCSKLGLIHTCSTQLALTLQNCSGTVLKQQFWLEPRTVLTPTYIIPKNCPHVPNFSWIIMSAKIQKEKAQKYPNKNAMRPWRQLWGCSSSVKTSLHKAMVIKFPVSPAI